MNKKELFSLGTVSILSFLATYFGFKRLRRSLLFNKLISKDTKVLNIYTEDYVNSNIFVEPKDEKKGIESFVFTNRAKGVYDIDIFCDNIPDEKSILSDELSEKREIASYIKELEKVAKGASIFIHVGTGKKANDYLQLMKDYEGINKNKVEIKIFKKY